MVGGGRMWGVDTKGDGAGFEIEKVAIKQLLVIINIHIHIHIMYYTYMY